MAKRNVVDFKIINLSEEKFQELKEAGQIDPNALYTTPDTTKERLDALEGRATSLETKTASLETTTGNLTTTKANDNSVVHLTGDEIIDGIKQFLKEIVPKTPVLARKETDDSFIEIWSGSSYDRGAFLSLYGRLFNGQQAGSFDFCATDGTTFNHLTGKPSGALTWRDQNIAVVDSYVNANKGYIKLTNGLLIQWGDVAAGEQGYASYATPFSSTNYSLILNYEQDAGTDTNTQAIKVRLRTTTAFNSACKTHARWIAIGF